ncbi:MAG: HEAT repeat domain-containing protein [Pirellulales bacterium]|nr:HEAT repeat domain-containing protein [Pirellulales bacterium]
MPTLPILQNRCLLVVVAALACASVGCTADDLAQMRPVFLDRFVPEEDDGTTAAIVSPSQRIEQLRELGETAASRSPAEQQQIAATLAKQIQREQDPLVRQVIIRALAKTPTPLAGSVILAGLKDPDRDVRATCCHAIASRGGQDAAAQLTQVLERDNSVDVRIAAIRALGELKNASALPSLVPALESRDPAIQFAAIDATRAIRTSQGASDLGNDVNAWLAYARGQQPPIAAQPESSTPLRWAKRMVPGWN